MAETSVPTDLRFDEVQYPWRLRISEYTRATDGELPKLVGTPIELHLRGLGKEAELGLQIIDEGGRYAVRFSGVAFGTATRRVLTFQFRNGKTGWEVFGSTDMFVGLAFAPLPLASFGAGATLQGEVSRASANEALTQIFDGHLGAAGECEITLDRSLVWCVRPLAARLTAYDEQVELGGLKFHWSAGPDADLAEVPAVVATGIEVQPVAGLTVGDASLSAYFTPDKSLAFSARSPGRDGRRAEVILEADKWLVHFDDEAGRALGTLQIGGEIQRRHEHRGNDLPDELTLRVRGRIGAMATLDTRIGRLDVLPPETEKEAEKAEKAKAERPFTLVATSSGSGFEIQQVNAVLLLTGARAALPDAQRSRLSFDSSALRLIYATRPVELPASYLWLGPRPSHDLPVARLDLTRATLSASRGDDLLSLTFRFADLALTFSGASAWLKPLPEYCRVITRGRTEESNDNRPVLVVELPPQHVLEEALFRQELPPPPERKLDKGMVVFHDGVWPYLPAQPKALAERLKTFKQAERAAIRRSWQKRTVPTESDDTAFATFADDFERAAKNLPPDQQVYIGPYGLDVDGQGIARALVAKKRQADREGLVKSMFDEVGEQFRRVQKRRTTAKADSTDEQKPWVPSDLEEALLLEKQFEQAIPSYQLFRDYYRSQMVDAFLGVLKPLPEGISLDAPASVSPREVEYVSLTSRTAIFAGDELALLDKRDAALTADYKKSLSGEDEIPDTVNGRLSTRSRLAFRLNCGTAGDEFGELDELDKTDRMPFTLDALTDWSRHELSVVRRSQRLFEPRPSGLMVDPEHRQANLDDTDMLRFQGFEPGRFATAMQRLAAVEATLRRPPGPLETSIDLPSRVILSTAQDAQFQTPRYFPEFLLDPDDPERKRMVNFNWRKYGDNAETAPLSDEPIRARGAPAQGGRQRPLLWSASIDPEGNDPGLRVVHSPDFRPEFFWSQAQRHQSKLLFGDKASLRLPGNGAPPRGPYAPWLLGREETSNPVPSADQLLKIYADRVQPDEDGDGKPDPLPDDPSSPDLCEAQDHKTPIFRSLRLPWLIDYLCRRQEQRKHLRENTTFRSSLDAYDRHELVLLSSAYGMPVLGRRDQQYSIVAGSDQFEPADDYSLMDVRPGSAIYRPKSLDVRELTLTALGGTLRHDTSFVPPASAQYLDGSNLFDALSVERWQHWTVLGRDVFTEVVYKGFLFPLGHRASLVKLTERTFMRSKTKGIKAFLRQRLFIRVGKPEKAYPALRQAVGGRQFPVAELNILTVKTPDIVDPTSVPMAGEPPSAVTPQASGRLVLGEAPGLAFWPRTAMTPRADVMFDITVEGRATRLPLIFVDNTAAHDPASLLAIAEYYNKRIDSPDDFEPSLVGADGVEQITPDRHKRTIRFAGQQLRYADERKAGDGSHETDSWTLKAEGRRYPRGGELAREDFEFDPLLEGADQPPFYPAIETARITLRQTERFSGTPATASVAQFDENYVLHGFPPIGEGTKTPATGNTSEVYLDLVHPMPMTIGGHGDRTGGLFRPESKFVAVSRLKGPLGGLPVAQQGIAADQPISRPGTLIDRAKNYDVAQAPLGPNAADDAVKNLLTVYKRYFDLDTKLLGLIRIGKLLEFLGLKSPNEDMPLLKEAKEYGVAQMSAATGAAQSAAADVRGFVQREVVSPLLDVVTRLEVRWDELQEEMRKSQPDQFGKAVTLQEVFPEIGTGLTELRTALEAALGITETVAFTAAMAEIYEAGRRLIAGLDRVAANPAARVEAALRNKIDELTNAVAGAIAKGIADLKTLGAAVRRALTTRLIATILPGADADDLVTFGDLLPSLPSGLDPNLEDTLSLLWESPIVTVGDVRTLLASVLESGKLDSAAAASVLAQVKSRLNDAASKVVAGLAANPRLKAISERVDTLVTQLGAIKATGRFEDVLLPMKLRDEVRLARQTIAAADDLAAAFETGAIDQAARALLRIADLLAGSLGFAGDLAALKDTTNAYVRQLLAKAVEGLRESTLTGAGATDPLTRPDGILASLDKVAAEAGNWASSQANKDLVDRLEDERLDALAGDVEAILEHTGALANDVRQLSQTVRTAIGVAKDLTDSVPADLATIDVFTDAGWDQLSSLIEKLKKFKSELLDALVEGTDDLYDGTLKLTADISSFVSHMVDARANLDDTANLLNLGNLTPTGVVKDATLAVGRLNRELALAAAVGLSKLFKALAMVSSLADQTGESVTKKLEALRDQLPAYGPLREAVAGLVTELATVASIAKQLDAAAAQLLAWQPTAPGLQQLFAVQLDGANLTLRTLWKAAADAAIPPVVLKLKRLAGELHDIVGTGRRTFAGLGTSIAVDVFTPFVSRLLSGIQAGGATFPGLIAAYEAVKTARDGAKKIITDSSLPDVFKTELIGKLNAPVTHPADPAMLANAPTDDQLDVDLAMLGGLRRRLNQVQPGDPNPVADPAWQRWVTDHLRQWSAPMEQPEAAPLVIASNIKSFAADLLRGDWFKLIDVSAIRDEIEKYLKNLIPLRATLAYSFGGAFTSGAKQATLGIFDPQVGTRLDISVAASVEFQRPEKVKFDVHGYLGPFTINLVGDLIDAVSIKFHGATFKLDAGGKPKLNVDYNTFVIGKDLEYVQKLQSLFGPSDGSGFYLQPTFRPLGIEAGYGIGLPIISFGNVSFSNISLNAAVVIPFDGSEARFRASLSRRDAPFTISVAPYGGSGFFAIEANAEGIVGFEASFEFGGAAAFQYGPLKGIGRLMLGTYIRQTKVDGRRSTELGATFYVGGSAAIWIFSFGASLYVRLSMVSGGAMQGIATFTFSFSIGIADYDYSISVARTENKVGNDDQESQKNDEGQTGSASAGYLRVAGPTDMEPVSIKVDRRNAVIRNATTCQGIDWSKYQSYFDQIEPDDANLFESA